MRKISLVEGTVFKNPEVPCCDRFKVVVTCNGESDFLVCCKCGRGWVEPCKHKNRQENR